MDITSLLQEAPSRDWTRRRPQSSEESAKRLSTSVEDQLPTIGALSGSLPNPPRSSGDDGGHQHQPRSFHVLSDYPNPPPTASLHPPTQSHSQSQPQPSPAYSYYHRHLEREKDRVSLPLNPALDYVDVGRHEGATLTNRQDYLKQSQLQNRPLSSSQPLPSPAPHQHSLSDIGSANPSLPRVRPAPEEIAAQTAPVDRYLPPPPPTPSPVLDPVHLGSYIYPSLPFPLRPSAVPYNRRTTLTVLVPSSLLPHHHHSRTKTAGIYADPRARRLWGGVPQTDQRKMYTDDSDPVFAALHSGVISDDPVLFSSGKELKLTLRLYPAPESGHFTGGEGAAGLTSASWGNSHEGCAYTILEAKWLDPSTTHSYTRQTRKARMAEYAQRRAAIMDSDSSSFLLSPLPFAEPSAVSKPTRPGKSLPLKPDLHPIEENLSSLSVVGGWRAAVGFKYDPMTLYLMLFALSSSSMHAPKRRKLEPPRTHREIILANSTIEAERFILAPLPPLAHSEPDSAMQVDGGQGTSVADSFMRYDLYREVRNPSITAVDPKAARANENQSANPKGVHFTEDVISKDEARDTDRNSWTRTLLHSNLGPQDIMCIPGCLLVGDDKYPVETWRWKSDSEEGKRPGAKASQPGRSKKRGQKKRKTKPRKPKVEGAVADTASIEKAGSSKGERAGLEPIGSAAATAISVEATATSQADKPREASSNLVSKETPPPLAGVSVVAKEDREEGELSDETPAAAAAR